MPRGDRTGPNGKGPRTGRGLGTCDPSTPRVRPKTLVGKRPPRGGFGGRPR